MILVMKSKNMRMRFKKKKDVAYKLKKKHVEGMKLWPMLNRLPVLHPPNRLGNRGRPSTYARQKIENESSSSSTKTKLSRENRVMTCSNCR